MTPDPDRLPLPDDDPPPPADGPAWVEFARAPLVPVALAVTAGLIADRYVGVSLPAALAVATVALTGWILKTRYDSAPRWPVWLAFAALAAAYHHSHRHSFPPDDIGQVATPDAGLARVRGTLTEDPVTRFVPTADPFAPPDRPDRDAAVMRVTAIGAGAGVWVPASGLARLTVLREPEAKGRPPLAGLRAGDAVELVGMLTRPGPPSTPGESDYADYLLDQRIRAELRVTDSVAVVARLDRGGEAPAAVIAAVRRGATSAIIDHLPAKEAAVAVALLLGDGSAMDRAEWDAYVRTGVVHALAISGQHLVVLAGFLWLGLRAAGVRRSRGAWVVLVVVVGYAVLTGLRPSGVRAAVMVAAVCGGLMLRRRAMPANCFALGWLAVVALNPTDPFTLGCRLSFLSVFVMVEIRK